VIYVGAVHTVQDKQGKADMNDTKGQKNIHPEAGVLDRKLSQLTPLS
jgi:hypothetical protein